jgi:ketosteroid isomerase-like protein
MPQNVEIFQRALDAFNRRDKALWLAVCDPEMENVPPRDWPESDPTRGPDAIWDFFVQGNDPWERAHFDYFDPIDAGKGRIVAEIRGEMQCKGERRTRPMELLARCRVPRRQDVAYGMVPRPR